MPGAEWPTARMGIVHNAILFFRQMTPPLKRQGPLVEDLNTSNSHTVGDERRPVDQMTAEGRWVARPPFQRFLGNCAYPSAYDVQRRLRDG